MMSDREMMLRRRRVPELERRFKVNVLVESVHVQLSEKRRILAMGRAAEARREAHLTNEALKVVVLEVSE
jgi:hypothetical protein